MIGGALGALVVAVLALAFVAAPLLRRERAADQPSPAAELDSSRDLQSRHDMLLAALRDLEDDRATAKLDEADYAELHARLSGEAVQVMRKLDEAERERERAELARHPVLPYPNRRRPEGSA